MKNQRIRWLVVLLAVLFSLAACSNNDAEDASNFVNGLLDTITRNENEEYRKLSTSSEAEAKALYEDSFDMSSLAEQELSDELLKNYREQFQRMYGKTKYTVGESEKVDENTFTVPVDIETLRVYTGLDAELDTTQMQWMDKIIQQVEETGEAPDDAEVMEIVYQHMYDIIDGRIDDADYAEKTTIKVEVTKDEEGFYSLSSSDFQKLEDTLVDFSEMSS